MPESALERLVAAVQEHYLGDAPAPLLLSAFGQRHKVLLTDLKAEFGSLAAAVRAAGEDRLRFIDTRQGREAVAPAGIAAGLQQQLQENTAAQRESAAYFDSLPLAVRLAFCVRTEAGEQVAVDTVRPFHYSKVTAPDLLRPTQRLIPEIFRRPGLDLRSASIPEREALWRHFVAWVEQSGVDPSLFRRGETTTALNRLIASQPPDVVARMVIPADIAQLLLKHP